MSGHREVILSLNQLFGDIAGLREEDRRISGKAVKSNNLLLFTNMTPDASGNSTRLSSFSFRRQLVAARNVALFPRKPECLWSHCYQSHEYNLFTSIRVGSCRRQYLLYPLTLPI